MAEPYGRSLLESLPVELLLIIFDSVPGISLIRLMRVSKYISVIAEDHLHRRILPLHLDPSQQPHSHRFRFRARYPPFNAPNADTLLFQSGRIRNNHYRSYLRCNIVRGYLKTANLPALQHFLQITSTRPYFDIRPEFYPWRRRASKTISLPREDYVKYIINDRWNLHRDVIDACLKTRSFTFLQELANAGLLDFGTTLMSLVDNRRMDPEFSYSLQHVTKLSAEQEGYYQPRPVQYPDKWDYNLLLQYLLNFMPPSIARMYIMTPLVNSHSAYHKITTRFIGHNTTRFSLMETLVLINNPGSLVAVEQLSCMVGLLRDKTTGEIIPKAGTTLFNVLHSAETVARYYPRTRSRMVDYLLGTCASLPRIPMLRPAAISEKTLKTLNNVLFGPVSLNQQHPMVIHCEIPDRNPDCSHCSNLMYWLVSSELQLDEDLALEITVQAKHRPWMNFETFLFPSLSFGRWKCFKTLLDLNQGIIRSRENLCQLLVQAVWSIVADDTDAADVSKVEMIIKAGGNFGVPANVLEFAFGYDGDGMLKDVKQILVRYARVEEVLKAESCIGDEGKDLLRDIWWGLREHGETFEQMEGLRDLMGECLWVGDG